MLKAISECLIWKKKFISSSISSRLDYCNSLFTCLNQKPINRLQTVQNSAARLLTRSKRSDHITPILASLHWLPVCFRIDLKILLLTFKALQGLSPCYISDLLVVSGPARSLRSSGRGLYLFPRNGWKLEVTEHTQSEPRHSGTSCLRKPGRQNKWPLLNLFLKHTFIWELFLVVLDFFILFLYLYYCYCCHDLLVIKLLPCVKHFVTWV